MKSVQEVFDEIKKLKEEQKEIRKMYKDALANADKYEEITEEAKDLKEKKKQIETRVQSQMGKSWERFEEIKDELESQKEMMSDIAMTTLMDGKTVEVKDEYDNQYEPVYTVTFRKVG